MAISAQSLDDVMSVQRKAGVFQALEVTRPYAFDTSYVRELRDAGVFAINITLGAPDLRKGISPARWSFYDIARSVEDWYDVKSSLADPGLTIPATTVKEIRSAKESGGIAIVFGLQGAGNWLDRELVLLRTVYRLGVRIVGVSYQKRDWFTDGTGEPANAGLSRAGRDFVREMNRLGMVIDLSHTGERASLEAIELTERPVVFSHSNVRSLFTSVRNLSDEQIAAVAQINGVIGVAAFTSLFKEDVTEANKPTVDDFLEHLDYLVERAGIDHVGVGLDYGHKRRQEDLDMHNELHPEITRGIARVETVHCRDLDGPSDLHNLTSRLIDRGYTEADIAKILSGNFMRVFEEVCDH